ncbi:hypothetical protein [Bacillus sp. SM2101]|uniref:hypothetical protein n=1 Tax=Bacillus sp. SM2101 TaxID=2805366 RepID=UPI001BDE02CC|nr:hypothetical protein [Bacillus sp. SM2101]
MTLIAPINHEQYSLYALRTIPFKQDMMKFNPVYKSSIDARLQEQSFPISILQKRKYEVKENEEKLYYEITGKGKYINELV